MNLPEDFCPICGNWSITISENSIKPVELIIVNY